MKSAFLSALLMFGIILGTAATADAKCRVINKCNASGSKCYSTTMCRKG
jgi:hypothetical protein